MTKLKEQLQAQIMPTEWKELAVHYEREAVIVISTTLDLAEVGSRVAQDDKDQVGLWLSDRKIYKPSQSEVDIWEEENQSFNFLIIQPFVLIQLQTSIH